MKKTIIKMAILVGIVGSCSQLLATTGELRTPLARFPYHYPLVPVDDGLWSLDCFHTAYIRSADQGFGECHGRNCVHLSKLFFGKSEFRGEEAFFGGAISVAGAPAELRFVKIRPRFKYTEKGLNFGVETERRFDDSKWRFGGQLSLPFKIIDVERNVCSATMTELENFDNAVCRQNDTLYLSTFGVPAGDRVDGHAVIARVPAYRLDFLTSLCQANGAPIVEYDLGMVRIAGIEVSKHNGNGGAAPMGVHFSADGTCPQADPYAFPVNEIGANNPDPGVDGISNFVINHWVTEAGLITAGGLRGAFSSEGVSAGGAHVPAEDYTLLGNNLAALSKLYVSPAYKSDPGNAQSNTFFEENAAIIMNAVEAAIKSLEEGGVISAEQFFFDRGVQFCQCTRLAALGDLDLNLYAGYDFTEDFWGKLNVGVIFPTGKKICDVGQLLAQATGNNGHFEIKGGIDLGWKGSKWFGVHLDAYYNHVFNATEWRAAPFTGATIKNIGPAIQAKVKWGYFTGHFDVTLFHPENQNLGCSLGYEAYVKRCDKICPCVTTAKEFELKGCCDQCDVLNPEEKELDSCILAQDTKRISHKIRGEVFHRWNYCEIFAGASRVIAGKNIMREAEFHLGFGIYW